MFKSEAIISDFAELSLNLKMCNCCSTHLLELIASVPAGRLTKQKMMTIDDIVHSQLFKMPECRSILLPGFTVRIKELLESREEVLYISSILWSLTQFLASHNSNKVWHHLM